MATSEIEWTDLVWNPTTGCNKVSPGCKNCYAEKMHKRLMGIEKMAAKYSMPFLAGAFPHEDSLLIPFKWKKGKNIFVNSMSDLFHSLIPVEFIAKVYAVMALTPQHTYQMLTKRPERRASILNDPNFQVLVYNAIKEFKQMLPDLPGTNYVDNPVLRNVWEGTSVENQETAEERIPHLLNTPAFVHWLSMEPLLGPVDLSSFAFEDAVMLDWIVVGGESGPKRRHFNTAWAHQIKEFCWKMNVPFFMKQIDKKIPIPEDLFIREYPRFKTIAK